MAPVGQWPIHAHAGITTPPNHTIRLTKEDEDSVKSLGFEPKFIGGNVFVFLFVLRCVLSWRKNDIAKIVNENNGCL